MFNLCCVPEGREGDDYITPIPNDGRYEAVPGSQSSVGLCSSVLPPECSPEACDLDHDNSPLEKFAVNLLQDNGYSREYSGEYLGERPFRFRKSYAITGSISNSPTLPSTPVYLHKLGLLPSQAQSILHQRLAQIKEARDQTTCYRRMHSLLLSQSQAPSPISFPQDDQDLSQEGDSEELDKRNLLYREASMVEVKSEDQESENKDQEVEDSLKREMKEDYEREQAEAMLKQQAEALLKQQMEEERENARLVREAEERERMEHEAEEVARMRQTEELVMACFGERLRTKQEEFETKRENEELEIQREHEKLEMKGEGKELEIKGEKKELVTQREGEKIETQQEGEKFETPREAEELGATGEAEGTTKKKSVVWADEVGDETLQLVTIPSIELRKNWNPTQFNRRGQRPALHKPMSRRILSSDLDISNLEDWWNAIGVKKMIEQDGRMVASATDDEIKDKEQLVELVKLFAQEAVSSHVKCEVNDHLTGMRAEATYKMDKELQKLFVNASDKETVIDLVNVQDVWGTRDMAKVPKLQNFLKQAGLAKLTAQEKERLVMIEFVDANQYMQRLCLLLSTDPSKYRRQTSFVKGLRILRSYAKVYPGMKK